MGDSFYFLVLTKQINSRFVKRINTDENNNEYVNPIIGTVIDKEIVDSPGKEFYLISQNARQGTVNPTKFELVYPENAPSPKNMTKVQATTFALTHMYYNWPSQIKVPAPCQYANKLATLIGEHMKMDEFSVSPSLADKLFYL